MNHDPTTLIYAYLDGELAEGEQLALAAWLREGQENIDRFTAECRLHSELCAACGDTAFSLPGDDLLSTFSRSDYGAPLPCPAPPIVLDASDPLHTPLFTLRSPLGSFVFSHIAAAVILGIGLLVGLAWRISLPSSEGPAPDIRSVVAQSIGRITALADCKWSVKQGGGRKAEGGNSLIPNHQSLIPIFLGDRFIVSSGLMEITYDTGAKVILEGPCTYAIDSDRGGYLAIGRLTAKVEKKAEGGRRRAEDASHYQLSTTNYPLFAVRTPTATVIDLGTEFGVEVEESGATRSYVFQGAVELRSSNSRRSTTSGESEEILRAGESACVERGRNRRVAITRTPVQPEKFMRRIPALGITHPSSRGHRSSSLGSRAWSLVDLGTLGGVSSYGWGVNNRGQVIGYSTTAAGAEHAFLYSDGKMTDLGTLGGSVSYAYGVNDRGQVVGKAATCDGDMHAFLYDHGKMIDLGTFGGKLSSSADINELGQVVGYAQTDAGVNHAFLFSNGAMRDLGTFGGLRSSANGINVHGHVTGCFFDNDDVPHAFLWNGRDVTLLGNLGGKGSVAMQVNDAGHVVGHAAVTGDKACRAFVYGEGIMKDLGSPQGGSSEAYRISENGLAVGRDEPTTNASAMSRFTHACLFDTRTGTVFDLNSLIDPAAAWLLVHATDVNRDGMIVGYGSASDGGTRAFLLVPNH